MSNDLISRSALIQSLRNNMLVDVTSNLEQAIIEQPTTYDMDKVVEQLEKLVNAEYEKESNCDENGFGDGEQIYEDGRTQGMYEAYRKALEIVKSGGIEEKKAE